MEKCQGEEIGCGRCRLSGLDGNFPVLFFTPFWGGWIVEETDVFSRGGGGGGGSGYSGRLYIDLWGGHY